MHMKRLSFLRLTVSLSLLILLAGSSPIYSDDDAQKHDLSRQLKIVLDKQVFPAMQHGADAYFYEVFGPVLSKASSEQADAIETYARSLDLDSPIDKFVDLKLRRIERGVDSINSKMKLKEARYLIGGVNKQLDKFIKSVQEHPFMQDPIEIPEHWKDARDQFWDAHVAKNEFLNKSKLLAFGNGILRPIKTAVKNAKDPAIVETLDEFNRLAASLSEVYRDLEERTAEARLIRFERSAETVLGDGDFEEKFIAGMSVQMDAEALVPFLENRGSFDRPALQRADLVGDIRNKAEVLIGAEPDIINKAYLFRTGLHWWLRGRYGHGVEHGGLIKSKAVFGNYTSRSRTSRRSRSKRSQPGTKINYAALNALYMPRERPDPEFRISKLEPVGFDGVPDYYRRRHYYTWAIEHRPIVSSVRYTEKKEKIRSTSSSTQTARAFENENFFW